MADAGTQVQTEIMTLSKFIIREQSRAGHNTRGDFSILLNALSFTCKAIAYNIRRASLINLVGLAGTSNATGDDQKKLDVIGNDIFVENMRTCGKVAVIVSEEEEEAIIVEHDGSARYCIVCDPIDGSSNLDAGVSVGTIFGIYRLAEGSNGTVADVLRPGTEMICGGYCMYAASANLVMTTGQGVNGFTLDNALGEFILTHPNIRIPKARGIYSINEGNAIYYDKAVQDWIQAIKFPTEPGAKPYSARYIGSMVADMHRTLLYGGIFSYPADKKSKDGKLRLLYECFPMALLVEQAGGMATDGRRRILDIVPENIHSRSGIFIGSSDEVNKAMSFFP